MDLKGIWQGRHISGGTTTYPFKAKIEQVSSGYVLTLQADGGGMGFFVYANKLLGPLHDRDTFSA